MPIPTSIADLSKVASENSPAGTESVKGTIDDYLRAGFAFLRQLSDMVNGPTVALPSAATVQIGFAGSLNISITGTTTINAFDTIAEGTMRWVTFAGALTLTHNATSLQLPGAANITTTAGDVALFKSLGGGNWKCVSYQRISGAGPVAASMLTDGYLSKGDWNSFNSRLTPAAAAANYLPLSGGQMTNALTFKPSSIASGWILQAMIQPDDKIRWQMGLDSSGTANFYTYNSGGTYTGNIAIKDGGFDASGPIFGSVVTGKSDERLKKKWRRRPADLLQRVAGIRKLGDFTWKKDGAPGIGVSAQELEAIWPEAVHLDDKGFRSVNYGGAAFVIAVELARAFFAYVTKTEKRLAKLEGK